MQWGLARMDEPGPFFQVGLRGALERLFPRAREDTILGLRSTALVATYQRDDRIRPSEEGRPPVVVVLSGVVARRTRSPEAHEYMEGVLEASSIGGLLSLRSDRTTDTELIARTEVVGASWHHSRISDLATNDGGFALDLLDHSVGLALDLAEILTSRVYESAEARLARLMVSRPHLVFDPGRPIIRRAELGHFVGASREMCERILRDFEERGLVRREGHSGLVELDRAGLQAAVTGKPSPETASVDPRRAEP
jgi:hypothetical protein